MFGTHSTKKNNKAENGKVLSVKDLITIIQACEKSKVQSIELDSLKIQFASAEKANPAVSTSSQLPDSPSKDDQPNKSDSLQEELDNLQLQISDPLAWEEKNLGQSE